MLRVLRTTAVLAAIASASIAATTGHVAPPAVGAPAPDFKLVDQNGRAETLSAARGKKIVLVFYRGYW